MWIFWKPWLTVCDNKIFWKSIIAPFFLEQVTKKEGSKVITDDEKYADTFNTYFNGALKALKILVNEDLLENVIDIDDTILAATENYMNHPSILNSFMTEAVII